MAIKATVEMKCGARPYPPQETIRRDFLKDGFELEEVIKDEKGTHYRYVRRWTTFDLSQDSEVIVSEMRQE